MWKDEHIQNCVCSVGYWLISFSKGEKKKAINKFEKFYLVYIP